MHQLPLGEPTSSPGRMVVVPDPYRERSISAFCWQGVPLDDWLCGVHQIDNWDAFRWGSKSSESSYINHSLTRKCQVINAAWKSSQSHRNTRRAWRRRWPRGTNERSKVFLVQRFPNLLLQARSRPKHRNAAPTPTAPNSHHSLCPTRQLLPRWARTASRVSSELPAQLCFDASWHTFLMMLQPI